MKKLGLGRIYFIRSWKRGKSLKTRWNNILNYISDRSRKRYIRNELIKKFQRADRYGYGIIREKKHLFYSDKANLNSHNIDHLTNSLFRASKIVHLEMLEKARLSDNDVNAKLYNDIAKLVKKYYSDKDEKYENQADKLDSLKDEIIFKDNDIKRIKSLLKVL